MNFHIFIMYTNSHIKANIYYKLFIERNKLCFIINDKDFKNKMEVLNYSFHKIIEFDSSYLIIYLRFINVLNNNIYNDNILYLINNMFTYLLDVQKNTKY